MAVQYKNAISAENYDMKIQQFWLNVQLKIDAIPKMRCAIAIRG